MTFLAERLEYWPGNAHSWQPLNPAELFSCGELHITFNHGGSSNSDVLFYSVWWCVANIEYAVYIQGTIYQPLSVPLARFITQVRWWAREHGLTVTENTTSPRGHIIVISPPQ